MKTKDIIDILEIRILPPIAIGRLGSSSIPMDAYDLTISEEKPLDFRQVIPKPTFKVRKKTGQIKEYTPKKIDFKEVASIEAKDGKIHPVAPFLEVFAVTSLDPKSLVPLTTHLLEKAGLSIDDIKWNVDVGNIKIFRRTGKEDDKIYANLTDIKTHERKDLLGTCPNFLDNKTLPLGTIQFVAPTTKHPEIRLRYTPGPGKVYGSSLVRIPSPKADPVHDPVFNGDSNLIIYDENKGTWRGYKEGNTGDPATYTNPAQIFAGYYNKLTGNQVSWGYLDDECDGYVSVQLTKKDNTVLEGRAHISAGPPAFAPDTLPIRVVSDELEQILLGPKILDDEEVSIDEAEELVRRAFETVRLMNSAVMNGNAVNGQEAVASTMPRQDSNDFGRYFEPIMATSIVDNLALAALHERVYNGMGTGAAAWFSAALRKPEEIGDLSDEQRRKMPALMRGADGRALCLTRRQINKVIKAGLTAMFKSAQANDEKSISELIPVSDLMRQISYRGEGNPYCILPRTAISNCFPGLEFDFRNFWRRAFDGIVLIENNNYVIETSDTYSDLLNTRLVAIEGVPTMVSTSGPVFPNSGNNPLKTADNPNGVSFMEWSNNMATVLQKQGQDVICHFTINKPGTTSETEVVVTPKDLIDKSKYRAITLKVNHLFEKNTATFSKDTLRPGELTQGLCAPWQNDYRECACYYWAASRPDFVNVVPNGEGLSAGDNWMAKERSGEYIVDNRTDSRLLSYDDLFENWEGELNFIIKGNDAINSNGD